MTFVDTSAIYAVLDRGDSNHAAAKACWFTLLENNSRLFTTKYVVVESCALAQSRLGLEAVRSISDLRLAPRLRRRLFSGPSGGNRADRLEGRQGD